MDILWCGQSQDENVIVDFCVHVPVSEFPPVGILPTSCSYFYFFPHPFRYLHILATCCIKIGGVIVKPN